MGTVDGPQVPRGGPRAAGARTDPLGAGVCAQPEGGSAPGSGVPLTSGGPGDPTPSAITALPSVTPDAGKGQRLVERRERPLRSLLQAAWLGPIPTSLCLRFSSRRGTSGYSVGIQPLNMLCTRGKLQKSQVCGGLGPEPSRGPLGLGSCPPSLQRPLRPLSLTECLLTSESSLASPEAKINNKERRCSW